MSRIEIDLDASANVLTGAISLLQFLLEKRAAAPAKRGPGRPRKQPVASPVLADAILSFQANSPTSEGVSV